MEQKTLLACRDVSLGYEGRAVWEHLNLEIRSGEYLCIVGENGSGKSTLLKSLLGLIKPLRGSIELDPSLRSGAIGYLPQQTRAQKDFPATVSEVGLSERARPPLLLYPRREVAGAHESRQARDS